MSVSITLEDDIDISRGDMIVKENNQPTVSQDIDVMVCWLNATGLRPGAKYYVRHTTKEVRAVIKEVVYKMDINNLQRIEGDKEIRMNDIGRVRLRTTQPLLFDAYRKNRTTGSLILIDETTNETVAAGMIVD
jgi:sulfate adenylyltransferase subunit 1